MNLPALFRPSLVDRPNAIGLEFQGSEWSFGRLESESNRLARALPGLGAAPGDRVAVYLRNRVELILLYLAAAKAGLIFTPINILYRSGEIAHILDDAEPKLLFHERDAADLLEPLLRERPTLEARQADGMLDWTSLESDAPLDFEPAASDVAALVYTSGTTGRPKGAMLTQANFAANALALVDAWRMSPDDRLLLSLPLFHVHGLGNGLHTWLACGYRVRLLERFRKETIVEELLDFGTTVFFGVPTMYERLLETPQDAAREIGSRMRLFVSGSAPLPAATLKRFEDLFGHTILERYGMSETLMNTSNPYDGKRRPGSVGPPLGPVEVRICSPDAQEPLTDGETGEVQIRGPNVFAGYWRRPEATREAFTADGWFRSGDLGFRSADGYVTLCGRGKELIISGGFNVYPREIEEYLTSLSGIREAAVVGRPDPVKGETPAAYVAADPAVDVAELERLCRENLASFKVPRRFTIVESLPRNALGKVQKHLLGE